MKTKQTIYPSRHWKQIIRQIQVNTKYIEKHIKKQDELR